MSPAICRRFPSLIPLIVLTLPASALAQRPASEGTGAVSTVVVTATKREQTQSGIDGSVAVKNASELAARNVTRTDDLERVFPQLLLRDRSSRLFPSLTLRGLPSLDFYNPSVAVYVDGVPQDQSYLTQPLLNVERVELLEGPQGTLYGHSAQAGVVNIVSRSPDRSPFAQIIARGDTHERASSIAVGGALPVTGFSAELTAHYLDRLGSLRNAAGRTDVDRGSGHDARGGLRYTSASIPLQISLNHSRSEYVSHEEYYLPFDQVELRTAPQGFAEPLLERTVRTTSLTARYDIAGWRFSAVASEQRRDHERLIGSYGVEYPETQRARTYEAVLTTRETTPAGFDATIGLYGQSTDFESSTTYLPPAFAAFYGVARSSAHVRSEAAFGETTYHFDSRWRLTGGLRFTRARPSTRFDRSGSLLGNNFSFSGRDTFTEVTPKLSLGFEMTPGRVVYALYSEGFKAGGFNRAGATMGNEVPFGSEISRNYEIGARFIGLNDTLSLNASLYRIDTSDVQMTVGDAAIQVLRNVGDARSEGLEADVSYAPVEAWRLSLSGMLNRSRFVRFDDPVGSADFSGNRMPYAPRATAQLALDGKLEAGRLGTVLPRAALRYVASHYFDPANQLRQPSYTVLEAQLAWRPLDMLEVALYGNNLTDRTYRVYAFDAGGTAFAQVAAGRAAGVRIDLSW